MRKANIWGAAIAVAVAGSSLFLGGAAANAAPATQAVVQSTAASTYVGGLDLSKQSAVKKSEIQSTPAATAAYAHCNSAKGFTRKADPREDTTAPVYGSSTTCILETGNSGLAVSALQNSLNNCYTTRLTLDGKFGPATYNALLKVQRAIGVTIDGVYGPQTRDRMLWSASDITCSTHTAYNGF